MSSPLCRVTVLTNASSFGSFPPNFLSREIVSNFIDKFVHATAAGVQ